MKTLSSNSVACNANDGHHLHEQTMKLIGDFWTLQIVDSIGNNELRFCEIERKLPGINPVTLTSRLKKLVEAEVVLRQCETCDKQSVTYKLTDKGHALLPILEQMKAFSHTYLVS